MSQSATDSVQPSVARNSLARLSAESLGAVFGLVGGAITARYLGPAGKGVYATLIYILSLCIGVAIAGLGDAGIVFVGRKRATLQQAVAATLSGSAVTIPLGIGLLWGIAMLQFGDVAGSMLAPLLLATLALPLATYAQLLSFLANARERIVATSVIHVSTIGATTAGLGVLVVLVSTTVTAAVAATVIGSTIGLVAVAGLLRSMHLRFRPRWDPSYLRDAFRYGIVVQLAQILMITSFRIDQLIVFGLAGDADAGRYSVALTVGQLVVYAPFAISLAAFPRVASLGAAEARAFVPLVFRMAIVSAALSAIALTAIVPAGIPAIFGGPFAPAVIPAIVLTFGGIFWAGQWALARAAAARGDTKPLFVSFSAALLVMVLLDLVAIPAAGIVGAASASAAGDVIGFSVCMATVRFGGGRLSLAELVPGREDVKHLARFFRDTLAAWRPASGDS